MFVHIPIFMTQVIFLSFTYTNNRISRQYRIVRNITLRQASKHLLPPLLYIPLNLELSICLDHQELLQPSEGPTMDATI